jgi:hypothetical protein
MGDPQYFTVVKDNDLGAFHIKEDFDNVNATYYVNKILANGTNMEDIQVICGYKVELNVGGFEC